jgi:hypothetical protein
MKLNEIFDKLKSYKKAVITAPPFMGKDDTVPAPYLEFLRFTDGAELFVPGTVLYGVNSSEFPTLKAKNTPEFIHAYGLDANLTVIGHFVFGDLICMEGSVPHRLYLWDVQQKARLLEWNTLEEFLKSEIEDYESFCEEMGV